MKNCKYCNSSIEEFALFCPYCGNSLNKVDTTEQSQKDDVTAITEEQNNPQNDSNSHILKNISAMPVNAKKIIMVFCVLLLIIAASNLQWGTHKNDKKDYTNSSTTNTSSQPTVQQNQRIPENTPSPTTVPEQPPTVILDKSQQTRTLTMEEKSVQSAIAAKIIMDGSWPNQNNPYVFLGETPSGKIYIDTDSVEQRNSEVYAVALLVIKNDPNYKAIITEYLFSRDKKKMFTGSQMFFLTNGTMFDKTNSSWTTINPNTPASAVCKAAWERVDSNKSTASQPKYIERVVDSPTTTYSARDIPVSYATHKSERYLYSIDIPQHFQRRNTGADSLELAFNSPDDNAALSVYVKNNTMHTTAKKNYTDELNRLSGKTGYNTAGGNWFVITWKDTDDNLYYQKEFVGAGSIKGYILKFPERRRDYYVPIVEHIEAVYKPGDLERVY